MVKSRIFLILLMTLDFGPWTLDSLFGGYLDSRNWGETKQYLGARYDVLGSDLLRRHPVNFPEGARLELEGTFGLTSVWETRVAAKEPVSEQSILNNPVAGAFLLNLKPLKNSPVIAQIGLLRSQVFDYRAEQSTMKLTDSGKLPWLTYRLIVPSASRKFFLGVGLSQSRGSRDIHLFGPGYECREKIGFKGTGAEAALFGSISGAGHWGIGFESEAKIQATSYELAATTAANALTQYQNGGYHSWRFPAHWRFMLARESSLGKLFVGEIEWTRYSKALANGVLVHRRGSGFIFDNDLYQLQALGHASRVYPDFQDVVAFRFGFENPITSALTLRLGSQFETHYADPRIIEPTLALGLGMKLSQRTNLDLGAFLSKKDYFGDDFVWPKTHRLDETKFDFFASLKGWF